MDCGKSKNSNGCNINKGLRHEKVICKNLQVGQCAPIETVINNEQPPKPAKMLAKNETQFGENEAKWTAGLVAPECCHEQQKTRKNKHSQTLNW